MSLQSVETSTSGRVASRRNVIRGAAWSAGAVTIVVATPNIAAASGHHPGPLAYGGTAAGSVTRYNSPNGKRVTFNVTFTNEGFESYQLDVVATYKNGSQVLRSPLVTSGKSIPWPTALTIDSSDDDQTITLQYYAVASPANVLLGTLTFPLTDRGVTTAGTWVPAGP